MTFEASEGNVRGTPGAIKTTTITVTDGTAAGYGE